MVGLGVLIKMWSSVKLQASTDEYLKDILRRHEERIEYLERRVMERPPG